MPFTMQATTPRPAVPEIVMPVSLPALTGNPKADAAALCDSLMLRRLRWRLGACGPDAFDCWSSMVLLQKHLFGRDVAMVRIAEGVPRAALAEAFATFEPAILQWRSRERGEEPRHGDGVLMSHKDAPHHCGVWLDLDRGVVAHMAEHGGFSVDDRQALRLTGYTHLRFFEWRAVADV